MNNETYNRSEQESFGSNPYQQHQNDVPPIKPESNLVWGILCTCLCCIPFGIVSIVYANKVDSYWMVGLYAEAEKASRMARNWAIWGAIICVAVNVIILLLFLILTGLGAIPYFMESYN
ncbi:MAG: CD225/dispanin family protein [Bacteroidaceae bacterium]|nr:CD225/dispanin family protein [Bacteroidaceae bacterium]